MSHNPRGRKRNRTGVRRVSAKCSCSRGPAGTGIPRRPRHRPLELWLIVTTEYASVTGHVIRDRRHVGAAGNQLLGNPSGRNLAQLSSGISERRCVKVLARGGHTTFQRVKTCHIRAQVTGQSGSDGCRHLRRACRLIVDPRSSRLSGILRRRQAGCSVLVAPLCFDNSIPHHTRLGPRRDNLSKQLTRGIKS